MTGIRRITRHYAHARSTIRTGDLLLCRAGHGWFSRLIAWAGRGPWSHAAMAVWCNGVLMAVEMWWSGGRAVCLSSRVVDAPGRWDVFSAELDLNDGRQAGEIMLRMCSRPYGWMHLLRLTLWHVPLLWTLAGPLLRRLCRRGAPVCSEAAIESYRATGHDPAPYLPSDRVEPCDLAHTSFFTYLCTLVP